MGFEMPHTLPHLEKVKHTKIELFDDTAGAELFFGEFGESGHDPSAGGDGDEFDFRSADPPDRRKMILEEKMIRLVVETPLADDEVGAGVLNLERRKNPLNRSECGGWGGAVRWNDLGGRRIDGEI